MNAPVVSVVIPTYNRAALLRRTLESLVAQDLPPGELEVVVADDGSGDDTRAVVDSFAGRLSLKYHFQPDEGFRAGAARNAGARLATAPVLVFLDTGGLAGPQTVRAHRDAHRSSAGARAVIGYTYGYHNYANLSALAELLERHSPAEVFARMAGDPSFLDMRHASFDAYGFDLDRMVAPWLFAWTANFSVRADDFWAVGGFDEGFRSWGIEDQELGYRLGRHGVRLAVSRDAWSIETPHERDMDANVASSLANALKFVHKHPDPLVEIFYAIYLRGVVKPLEEGYHDLETWYADLLGWAERAPADVCADLAEIELPEVDGRPPRVIVFGCGLRLPESWPGSCTLVDFDPAVAPAGAVAGGEVMHSIGMFTPFADGAFDLAVVSPRMVGLWDEWGAHVQAEAKRVARAVWSASPDGGLPRGQ